ncbi:MAG: ABC transporter substrate-binding protein [Cenarchaeum sp. SB0663_bin_5]|nr:ABC transporter substrate-binding protein [Cenarchaeum sp. SB0663_bin_5]MYH04559.1 ABC transporter substrate-binding protein [Cenarchaeum sp. SB0675_bin_21]MYL10602.1 ABC transporter substrate-binding protein [Cenarchaeum sp. SB0669_bin_11]
MTLKHHLRLMMKILTVTIVAMFAITLTSSAFAQTDDKMMMMDSTPLSGTITIGGLFPLTGDISSIGIQMQAASELAVEDFNAYLEEEGAQWRFVLSSEDTATNPAIALEKIQALYARGISNIIGPITSGNTLNVKDYADSNDMLIMSCCSTAPNLAISGDSIYRFVPDDENQGNALGNLLTRDDIKAMVPVWRGDPYGDGLREAAAANFESRGGEAHPGVRYAPDTPELSLEAALLAKYVQEMADEHGTENVAVFVIAFDEIARLIQSASQHPILRDVSWYGTESTADSDELINDRIVSEFADTVGYTAMQLLPSPGPERERIQDQLTEELGTTPNVFAYQAYDSVWVLGKAIMKANSADSAYIKSVLYDVAATYSGATGSTALNDAGDLAVANYQVVKVEDGAWIQKDKYSAARDLLIPSTQPEEDVTIGSIYPLTGDLSARGPHRLASSQLGVADFNSFLTSLDIDWKLKLVSEDSETKATVAFDKAQVLKTRGIDVIIGIPASGNVLQVKSYTDTNNMLVLSCCSTSPTLAIPNDSIFRVAPDDATQARALAKLMETSGIEHLAIIHRGDDYADTLAEYTAENFMKFGNAEEPIRYIETSEYSSSVSLLADTVQELVDAHGADKVAVLMISFDESVNIVQTAASYPILDDVRWFGAETHVGVSFFADDAIADEFINSVDFTALFVSDEGNEGDVTERITQHIRDKFGADPASYVKQAYDAAWLIGLSILVSGSDDTSVLKETLPIVASTYSGALISTEMNENGDLLPLDLAIWQVIDSEWVEQGTYSLSTGTIIPK